jgi:hypothetical protein
LKRFSILWTKSTVIESLFDYILRYSYLLPIIAFILFHRKTGYDARVIIVLVYCCLMFLTTSAHKYIPQGSTIFTLFQSWFTFIEYLAFALIFLYSIENKNFRTLIVVLSGGFVLFQVLFALTAKKKHLDSVPVAVETILIFLFVFYFLYQEFTKETQLLVRNSMFWISIGIFFYLAGSFFFNILANHMSTEELVKYWYYSFLFDIIKNILIAIGLSVHRQKNRADSVPYLDMDFGQTANH